MAHICSFFLQRNLKLKQKYTGPFIKPCHGEERERERERERGGKEVETAKMTISLFLSALISLEDK